MAPDYDKKYLKKAGGHISRNVVQITIKMRTIVPIIQIIILKESDFGKYLSVFYLLNYFISFIRKWHCWVRDFGQQQ